MPTDKPDLKALEEANAQLAERLGEAEEELARLRRDGPLGEIARTRRALEITALLDLHRTAVHTGAPGRFHAAAIALGEALVAEALDDDEPVDDPA